MTIYRGYGGVNRAVKEQYRCLSGVNRAVKEQYRGYGGVNRKVFSANLVLYDNGINGGVENFNLDGTYGIVTFGASSVTLTSVTDSICILGSTNLINITNFTKLKVICKRAEGYFGLANAKGTSFYSSYVVRQAIPLVSTFTQYELDISSFNGSYYVAIRTGGNATLEISKMWLE